MKKVYVFYMFIMVLLLGCGVNAQAEVVELGVSQVAELQKFRSVAKLYAPNFVLIGDNAVFKVFATPNDDVKLTLDYGSGYQKQTYEQRANERGVAAISALIIDEEELVGKSISVEALVRDNRTGEVHKAVLQNETGTASAHNRVYIADKDAAKGFLFTPWKVLNQFIMNASYDERSGYDPVKDQIYYDSTPVYVRNMRDAQENVREVPRNINNSN